MAEFKVPRSGSLKKWSDKGVDLEEQRYLIQELAKDYSGNNPDLWLTRSAMLSLMAKCGITIINNDTMRVVGFPQVLDRGKIVHSVHDVCMIELLHLQGMTLPKAVEIFNKAHDAPNKRFTPNNLPTAIATPVSLEKTPKKVKDTTATTGVATKDLSYRRLSSYEKLDKLNAILTTEKDVYLTVPNLRERFAKYGVNVSNETLVKVYPADKRKKEFCKGNRTRLLFSIHEVAKSMSNALSKHQKSILKEASKNFAVDLQAISDSPKEMQAGRDESFLTGQKEILKFVAKTYPETWATKKQIMDTLYENGFSAVTYDNIRGGSHGQSKNINDVVFPRKLNTSEKGHSTYLYSSKALCEILYMHLNGKSMAKAIQAYNARMEPVIIPVDWESNEPLPDTEEALVNTLIEPPQKYKYDLLAYNRATPYQRTRIDTLIKFIETEKDTAVYANDLGFYFSRYGVQGINPSSPKLYGCPYKTSDKPKDRTKLRVFSTHAVATFLINQLETKILPTLPIIKPVTAIEYDKEPLVTLAPTEPAPDTQEGTTAYSNPKQHILVKMLATLEDKCLTRVQINELFVKQGLSPVPHNIFKSCPTAYEKVLDACARSTYFYSTHTVLEAYLKYLDGDVRRGRGATSLSKKEIILQNIMQEDPQTLDRVEMIKYLKSVGLSTYPAMLKGCAFTLSKVTKGKNHKAKYLYDSHVVASFLLGVPYTAPSDPPSTDVVLLQTPVTSVVQHNKGNGKNSPSISSTTLHILANTKPSKHSVNPEGVVVKGPQIEFPMPPLEDTVKEPTTTAEPISNYADTIEHKIDLLSQLLPIEKDSLLLGIVNSYIKITLGLGAGVFTQLCKELIEVEQTGGPEYQQRFDAVMAKLSAYKELKAGL